MFGVVAFKLLIQALSSKSNDEKFKLYNILRSKNTNKACRSIASKYENQRRQYIIRIAKQFT